MSRSPSPPERNYSDSWPSHKRQDSRSTRGQPNERDKPDELGLNDLVHNWSGMRSSSPPEKTPKAGVVRVTNGMNFPDQDSRPYRPSAISPPTGPRAGVKPRRTSPSRKGVYRRDENSGNLEYRDRDVIEKNRRKHPDNGSRHNFKLVADTYRPGYPETDRRYPNGRDRAYDDSSRSPPPRHGRDNADKSYVAASRSRDSTRDRVSQERSGSPLLRAREVAERITRESLNNLHKSKEEGPKRVEPPERYQADLTTGACSYNATGLGGGLNLSQTSLLSRGLLNISQPKIASEHRSADTDDTSIPPIESILRSVKQAFKGPFDSAPLIGVFFSGLDQPVVSLRR
ncbi:hypothetical protein FGG08_001196 [Glutinoglossum americanum]|uniref:Uncharacterized protein n=1 Tax=Glutinoglossum americanum TaxID=1670608 RepID=A0A9P8L311_9PEZI|nr:hypothetical protein FGG08_001196 [Glutinoglossum americanum]